MLKQPEVGDTVILKAIVTEVDRTGSFDCVKLNFIECDLPGRFLNSISVNRIHEVIAAPIKVGDLVVRTDDAVLYAVQGRKLLYIHSDPNSNRVYGVVAYGGDIPTSYPLDQLRKLS